MQEMQDTQVQSLSRENPLEKEVVPHSSILVDNSINREAWWATVHQGLQRAGHNWALTQNSLRELSRTSQVRREMKAVPRWTRYRPGGVRHEMGLLNNRRKPVLWLKFSEAMEGRMNGMKLKVREDYIYIHSFYKYIHKTINSIYTRCLTNGSYHASFIIYLKISKYILFLNL